MSNKPTASTDYAAWLGELKSRIQTARTSAVRLANRELILLYWDIGEGIVEKQESLGWGRSVVEQLGRDLKVEYPGLRGFSADNLWRMRQLFREYSSPGFFELVAGDSTSGGKSLFLEQPVPELLAQTVRELVAMVPWGHHIEVMKKVKSLADRLYYLRSIVQFGWTRRVLLNQIRGAEIMIATILTTSCREALFALPARCISRHFSRQSVASGGVSISPFSPEIPQSCHLSCQNGRIALAGQFPGHCVRVEHLRNRGKFFEPEKKWRCGVAKFVGEIVDRDVPDILSRTVREFPSAEIS